MPRRQQGRSYLGVLDCDSGSVSLLDIPFSDLSNVVCIQILITSLKILVYLFVLYILACYLLDLAGCWRWLLLYRRCFCKYSTVNCKGLSDLKCIFLVICWCAIFLSWMPIMHVFFSQVTLNESKTKVINFSIVWSSSPDVLQYKPFFSKPEIVEFPTSIPGQKAYAYFYPPSNPNFQGLPDEKPPLLVKTHGKWFIHTFGCFKIIIHFDPSKELCWSFRFIFR